MVLQQIGANPAIVAIGSAEALSTIFRRKHVIMKYALCRLRQSLV